MKRKTGDEAQEESSEYEKLRALTKLRIKIDDKFLGLLKSRGLNWSVMLQSPYNFSPTAFTSEIEGLKPKSFSQLKQLRLFNQFLAEPLRPLTYCIASAPNDGKAKLLAAWMMQYVISHTSSHEVLPLWHDLTGGFENKLAREYQPCSLLVLNNVGIDSTGPKMEKLRDLLEIYARVPRVVVVNGCDPFLFFTRHLRLPVHGLTYMTNPLVKKSLDI